MVISAPPMDLGIQMGRMGRTSPYTACDSQLNLLPKQKNIGAT